jgi:hypothetical protein
MFIIHQKSKGWLYCTYYTKQLFIPTKPINNDHETHWIFKVNLIVALDYYFEIPKISSNFKFEVSIDD